MRIRIKNEVGEIPDEEIEKIIEMHKIERVEKEKNAKALEEVKSAIATFEDQLKGLKENFNGLEKKIGESDTKINEEVMV